MFKHAYQLNDRYRVNENTIHKIKYLQITYNCHDCLLSVVVRWKVFDSCMVLSMNECNRQMNCYKL